MTGPILELHDVRKTFGDVVAVDRISMELKRGEFVTFLGPSGSGKTTTLQMVAGLQPPTSGRIMLDGKPLDPLPPYRRNIGVVFQHYALFPHMTLAGNIAFPLEMRGVARAEVARRVREVLELVGLPEHGGRYPRQLSGGQQQRVALARALVFKPPLLLMDEPLGALDKKLREQMQLEIARLHRELDASIVYVTHDQEEALVMSDRIAVFNEGRIEQIGTAHELYERPMTHFVAGFIGDSNFFSGIVRESAAQSCTVDTTIGRLRAFDALGVAAGDAVSVAVRPERLRPLAPGEEAGEDNTVEGTVTDAIYLGQSRKYLCRLADDAEVTVLQGAQDAERHAFAPGDAIRLAWRMADANALRDTGTPGPEPEPARRHG